MSKALNFINPDELSTTVVLTALNSFLGEKHGSKMAFLDGPPNVRMCEPIAEYIRCSGGEVFLNKPIKKIILKDDGSVSALEMQHGEMVHADAYVSTMPVDPLKLMLPQEWKGMPYFQKVCDISLSLYVQDTAGRKVMVALIYCNSVNNPIIFSVIATAAALIHHLYYLCLFFLALSSLMGSLVSRSSIFTYGLIASLLQLTTCSLASHRYSVCMLICPLRVKDTIMMRDPCWN